ncbi:hypothetical protein JZO70_06245 [Enterococcus sp. 669A]|uniref:Alternate signal-mediated exported protein, CPF_0494 family n=2 Tax=Candidatus Enterococcus moelleringii TaxID=2815325 RepID=A0ABS3LBF2_9ENTE|nr:hypothetical protein [Enterococcus sp. 669A]
MRKRKLTSIWRSRLIFLLPIVFIGLCVGSLVVYAAMTLQEQKENQFQVGNVETKIEEVFTKPTTIKPTVAVPKEVKIKNTGTIKQFVRVMIQPEIVSSITSGSNKLILSSKIGEEVGLDITGDWVSGNDGYYYYTKAVEPTKETAVLFNEVTLKGGLDRFYTGGTFQIVLKVEAIHCHGSKADGTGAFQEAWWQGKKPTAAPLTTINTALMSAVEE